MKPECFADEIRNEFWRNLRGSRIDFAGTISKTTLTTLQSTIRQIKVQTMPLHIASPSSTKSWKATTNGHGLPTEKVSNSKEQIDSSGSSTGVTEPG